MTAPSLDTLDSTDARACKGEPREGWLWHVLHVRSRQEKFLSVTLSAMGIAHFLPLSARPSFHGRRKVVVTEPLIPGYMFIRGSLDEAYEADRTGRVIGILPVYDQRRLHEQLKQIIDAMSRAADLHPYPYLRVGCRVEVHSGPFRGLRGIVKDPSHPDRLILQVEMLGRAVSLEIDGAALESLD